MRDRLDVYTWQPQSLPAVTSAWPLTVGHLTGYGESHYLWHVDYICPHIVTAGRGVFRTQYGEYTVRAGDMFCLWPGTVCEYFELPEHPWQFYWLHIIGEGDQDVARACGFREKDRLCFTPTHPARITSALQAIFAYYRSKETRDEYQALSLLHAFVAACRSASPEFTTSPPARSLVAEADVVIKSLLQTSINVSEIARALSVSRNTLFRAFKDELGISPCVYLQQARLQHAKMLLTQSELKLSTIAHAAGFANEKYFLRCFRAAEGLTPTQWRQRHRPAVVERAE